jgi:hypothetical protein
MVDTKQQVTAAEVGRLSAELIEATAEWYRSDPDCLHGLAPRIKALIDQMEEIGVRGVLIENLTLFGLAKGAGYADVRIIGFENVDERLWRAPEPVKLDPAVMTAAARELLDASVEWIRSGLATDSETVPPISDRFDAAAKQAADAGVPRDIAEVITSMAQRVATGEVGDVNIRIVSKDEYACEQRRANKRRNKNDVVFAVPTPPNGGAA